MNKLVQIANSRACLYERGQVKLEMNVYSVEYREYKEGYCDKRLVK